MKQVNVSQGVAFKWQVQLSGVARPRRDSTCTLTLNTARPAPSRYCPANPCQPAGSLRDHSERQHLERRAGSKSLRRQLHCQFQPFAWSAKLVD